MKLGKRLMVIMLTCMMFFITPISIMAESQEASEIEEYVVTESIEDSSELSGDASFEEAEVLNNISEEVVSEEAISEKVVISEETVSEEEDIPGEEDTSEEVIPEDKDAIEDEVVSEERNSQEVMKDESESLVENTTEELVPSPQNETDMAMVTGPTDVVMVQMLYIPSGTLVSSQDATVTASYSMFKVTEAAKVNTYSDGSMTAVITYTGSSFLKMYMGTAADAATATEGFIEAQYVAEKEYTYEVPLTALDTAVNAAVLSSKGSWKDNTITVSMAKVEEPEAPTLVSTQEATVTASYSMFKVAEAAKVNTYSDGSMTAVITYTGSSFLKMYMGTAEEAVAATEGVIEAQYVAEKEYTYEVPITALDTAINAAVLSSKGSWKDNTITVSLVKLEEPEPTPEVPILVSTQEATVTASYSMFKVAEAAKVNTYSDGSMTAVITYTGSSFLKMYMGTAAEAAAATEGVIEAQYVAEKEYTYEVPITALDTAINAAVLSSKGSWKDNTITVSLVKMEEPEPTPEPTPEVPADGSYTATVETGAAMFKVVDAKLTVKDGQMTAVITLSGTGYDYLYMGSAADAANAADADKIPFVVDKNGKYTYEIPVSALDTDIPLASHSSKNDKWFDRTLNFKSESLEKYVYIPADGTYSATAETGAAMFKVVNCVVTVKDGKMTALITLSGTGYDYLYMGSAADAANAADAYKIPFVVDENGKYTYEIPVSALDEPLAVASHSSKNDKWFDRTITIDSASLEAISLDEKPEITPTPEPTPTPDAGITDDEELEDMIENTKPGEVKDGTYKPSFGYKGGSGRVTMSCNKVVVKDGKATATIVFASPNFTYMKVSGTKYYNQNKGGNSTFVVPVKLNGTTSVAAETTAMSTPYEIEYTLYVYVDGTNVSGIKPPAPPASEKDEKDEEKTEEELAEELALEEAEEENGWGAFDSVQTEESADLDDVAEDDAVDTLAVTDGGSDTGSLMIPIIISGAAVLAIGAVIVRAYLTSKRKK